MLLILQFFGWNRQEFTLDDKKFKLYGGEIDLIRVPHQYWENRVVAAKAMGLNTIAVQLNWNAIEVNETHMDFVSEQNNLKNFIIICQKHEMQIVLRAGPQSHYFTSVGGVPMRMHYENVTTRDFNDKIWSDSVQKYIQALAEIVSNFTGQISMIQLEQLAGIDKLQDGYITWLRQIYIRNGIYGPFMQLEATVDTLGLEGTALGLSGTPSEYALNDSIEQWPNAPVFYGNLFTGDPTYFFSNAPKSRVIDLQYIIDTQQSFIFMYIIGGTNFGLEAAGITAATYAAYTTSNDFGAPLSENGYPTPTFVKYQKVLTGKNSGFPVITTQSIPSFNLTKTGSMASQDFIQKGIFKTLPTFESQRQKQGLGIYEFNVEPNKEAMFAIEKVRDYAMIYVDGAMVHIFDRYETPNFNQVINSGSGKIQIVVDTSGHHGHSPDFSDDKKGLWGDILFDNKTPTNFNLSLLSIQDFKPKDKIDTSFKGGVYKGEFTTNSSSDTYLDFADFKRGYVFVNGFNLGRYWNIKDNITKNHYSRMFCPGVYLKSGVNEVVVFDVVIDSEVIAIQGFELAFKCPKGYTEVGQDCIKE